MRIILLEGIFLVSSQQRESIIPDLSPHRLPPHIHLDPIPTAEQQAVDKWIS